MKKIAFKIICKKIAFKIIRKLCKYLDKVEPNFKHNFTYISIFEIPQEEKIGRLRISDGYRWNDTGVWIGNKNELYSTVMDIIEKNKN